MATESDERRSGFGVSPYDTAASGSLRFAVELLAWTAGPWAAAVLVGHWIAAVPALIVLMGAPAIFNTPGDKHTPGVPTPGPVRLALELALFGVAVAGAWVAWPVWAAVVVSVVVAAALFTGLRRARWLLQGAPPVG